jgi:hypothetical protein
MHMPTWITAVTVPLVIALANLFALFYFKWVPNVDEQKRHIKRAAWLALDVLTLAIQVASLWFLATHVHGPVTPMTTVAIALSAGCFFFCVIVTIIRRWLLRLIERLIDGNENLLDNSDRILNNADRHLTITERQGDALRTIADDPVLSIETARAVRALLGSREDASSPTPKARNKRA